MNRRQVLLGLALAPLENLGFRRLFKYEAPRFQRVFTKSERADVGDTLALIEAALDSLPDDLPLASDPVCYRCALAVARCVLRELRGCL